MTVPVNLAMPRNNNVGRSLLLWGTNLDKDVIAAFAAFAELCAVFDEPLTESPEATFPTSSLLASVSGIGPVSPSSIPAVTSNNVTISAVSPNSTSAKGYTIQTSMPSSGAGASETSATSPTNSQGSATHSEHATATHKTGGANVQGWSGGTAMLIAAGSFVIVLATAY